MSDIFISYASEDRDWARMLAQKLEEQGWSVWWDRDIPYAKPFDEVIEVQVRSPGDPHPLEALSVPSDARALLLENEVPTRVLVSKTARMDGPLLRMTDVIAITFGPAEEKPAFEGESSQRVPLPPRQRPAPDMSGTKCQRTVRHGKRISISSTEPRLMEPRPDIPMAPSNPSKPHTAPAPPSASVVVWT